MKIENADFDKQALARLLQTAYALDVTRLEFVPKGEESHSYIATTTAGGTYFVKVHMAPASPALAACYRFVHHLRTRENSEWVVAPHITVNGECLATLGDRAVALFDYVTGVTRAPSELTEQQATHLAGQLATLHNAVAPALAYDVPTETFAISFKSWLQEVLDAAEQPLRTTHAWAQATHDLIRVEKPHILEILAQVEESGSVLHAANPPLSVTHGDLASHNLILNDHGRFLMFDWGKLCLAPAARDLVGLWDGGNAALLTAYFRKLAAPTTLLQQTLTYYFHNSLLAIVTDYGSWLLLEEASPEEAENAWRGLQQVLPVNSPKIQANITAICAIAAGTGAKDEHDEQPT